MPALLAEASGRDNQADLAGVIIAGSPAGMGSGKGDLIVTSRSSRSNIFLREDLPAAQGSSGRWGIMEGVLSIDLTRMVTAMFLRKNLTGTKNISVVAIPIMTGI